jgi:hypothetical protein
MTEVSNQEPPIPKEKHNLQGLLIALIVVCVVGLPISYFTGHSNGYDSGYQIGTNKGYLEGFGEGWESGRFDFYYIEPEQKYGVYDLSDWLNKWKWIKPYQEGVFDCSEMSAYLEWKLENEGWHTKIIVGDSPFGSGRHAWLLVETSNGKYMPVESTNMAVVLWESPYFDNYFKYDHSFETIQETLVYSETEFDWWKS